MTEFGEVPLGGWVVFKVVDSAGTFSIDLNKFKRLAVLYNNLYN
jgi:hypothetical protein